MSVSKTVTGGISAGRARAGETLRLIRERGPDQLQFWLIALFLGLASGVVALAFRLTIETLQAALYGTADVNHLHSFAADMPAVWIVAIPTLGGLAVGVILNWFTPEGRVRSVADVIEGASLWEGRVEKRAGLGSALASLITLSTGGSSGREGPVVHLAAVISSFVSNLIKASPITGRDLMGVAVAAAVSASFNAPLAGALFALEVVLRHFAVHAFAPIAIAAVAGTVINRLQFGGVTEFVLPAAGLNFYQELPAFLILGLVAGLTAVVLMRAIFMGEDAASAVAARIRLPRVLRPAVAGFLLGLIAIKFPHIIGVGYETTSAALTGQLLLSEAVVFVLIKVLAVAITMGGRMGGGVFSPSLMVGALTGLAFGIVATSVFPTVSGAPTLYALAGMGAVAAAVLGAPISTTLIVFELTGDWQTGLAVMVTVSVASALASRLVDRSFFLTQLERRGIQIAAGPQAYIPRRLKVARAMRKPGEAGGMDEAFIARLVAEGKVIGPQATLAAALDLFENLGTAELAVVVHPTKDAAPDVIGTLGLVDVLKAVNAALSETAAEEHS